MAEDENELVSPTRAWRRTGVFVLAIVAGSAVVAIGLVLTGVIAQPETLIVHTVKWIFGQ